MKFKLSYGMYKMLKAEYSKNAKHSEAVTKSLKKLSYPFERYGRGAKSDEINTFDTDNIVNEVLLKLIDVCKDNLDYRGAKGTHKILKQWQSVRDDVTGVEV